MIYKAARDKETGKAQFYEKDTLITGSREFLEAMGASDNYSYKERKERGRRRDKRQRKKERLQERSIPES